MARATPRHPDPDPWKRHAIPTTWERRVVVGGEKLHVELEPGSWVTGGRLGILVRGRLGGATYRSRRLFDRATDDDLRKLLKRIRFGRCAKPGCRTRRLLGSDWPPARLRSDLCERHRLGEIEERYRPERERLAREEAAWDAKRHARGDRWKAVIWIHRNDGDDHAIWESYPKRPTKAELRKLARRHRSAVMGDWSVRRLQTNPGPIRSRTP